MGPISEVVGMLSNLRDTQGKAWALVPILLEGKIRVPEKFHMQWQGGTSVAVQLDESEGYRVSGIDQYMYGTGEASPGVVGHWLRAMFFRYAAYELICRLYQDTDHLGAGQGDSKVRILNVMTRNREDWLMIVEMIVTGNAGPLIQPCGGTINPKVGDKQLA